MAPRRGLHATAAGHNLHIAPGNLSSFGDGRRAPLLTALARRHCRVGRASRASVRRALWCTPRVGLAQEAEQGAGGVRVGPCEAVGPVPAPQYLGHAVPA